MFNFTLVLIATFISFFAFGTICGLREGTVISATLVDILPKHSVAFFNGFILT
jgi:hypothetical protein